MTTATDTTRAVTRAPSTAEMVGALDHAVKARLLALELWGCGSDPLGLTREKPDIVKIDQVGRELVLCGEVLEDLDSNDGLIGGQYKVNATEEMLRLIQECEDDAYKVVDIDQGGNPDDLALSQARVTMFPHTRDHIEHFARGGAS